MKNHYIPQFYLKRWAVDGRLVEFARRRPGAPEVVPIRRSPAATGYQAGLYDFVDAPPQARHEIENAFFSMVDSRAADALAAMDTHEKVLEPVLKRAWIMFLQSLITRHPDDILALKAEPIVVTVPHLAGKDGDDVGVPRSFGEQALKDASKPPAAPPMHPSPPPIPCRQGAFFYHHCVL